MPNLFTSFHTATRLDYHGQPYEVTTIGKPQRDLGQLWDKFKQMQKENQRDLSGGYQPVSAGWVEQQAEKQLNEME